MKLHRGLVAALAVAVALLVAPSAQAAFPNVFNGEVTCTPEGNIRVCSGKTLTFDGQTELDVNVFLPEETGGPEGPYPVIGDFHGWGGAKQGLTKVIAPTGEVAPEPEAYLVQEKDPRIKGWAENGYAVFSMSDRGWGNSCGRWDPDLATAACEQGFNHLMDDRYEVRDAQYLLGELADEGIAEPDKIGATGVSYGGGISMALASLRNREMEENGALVPWTSPEEGFPMEIAAAVPQWPWTDIAYALAPNGRNLDYVTESSYRGPQGNFPVGVWKASWNEGLNQVGKEFSNYNESDPEADIPGWLLRLKAGEPYTDPSINGIIKLLTTFHSSFYINHSVEPAPLLIQSGWNDDLFPVDEALRFYQRTRSQYPSDPISLYLADIGHSRSQNKEADMAAFNQRLEAWFAHYLKGEGSSPSSSVEALTTTCPKSEPSGGPFRAGDWSGLSPGEIRFQSSGEQTINPRSQAEEETPTLSSGAFDPIVGPKTPCVAVPEPNEPGIIADYRLPAAPAGGFTLMGSPTIVANVEAQSPNSEIAARLVDVAPSGTETLVARTLYRPTGGDNEVVFQLHPQGYHFAEGHVAKLELLPSDYPYGRFSNLQSPITVSNLELRLPVMEAPGSLGGLVQKPAPKVVPAGYQLAAEFQTETGGGGGGGGGGGNTTPPAPIVKIGFGGLFGRMNATKTALIVPLHCNGEGACSGRVSVSTKRPGAKGNTTLAQGAYTLTQSESSDLRLPLTKSGRKLVKSALAESSKKLDGVVVLNDSGRSTSLTLKRAVNLPRGK